MINHELARKADILKDLAYDMKRRIRTKKDIILYYEKFPYSKTAKSFKKDLIFAEAGLKRIEAYYYRTLEELLKDKNK
jgi:hypothetical protein